jgi:hypothetical protein
VRKSEASLHRHLLYSFKNNIYTKNKYKGAKGFQIQVKHYYVRAFKPGRKRLITPVGKKFFRSLLNGVSYSFDIVESEYDNQIAPSPTNFNIGGIIFKNYVFNKKVGF